MLSCARQMPTSKNAIANRRSMATPFHRAVRRAIIGRSNVGVTGERVYTSLSEYAGSPETGFAEIGAQAALCNATSPPRRLLDNLREDGLAEHEQRSRPPWPSKLHCTSFSTSPHPRIKSGRASSPRDPTALSLWGPDSKSI